jgi:hypothetical protein
MDRLHAGMFSNIIDNNCIDDIFDGRPWPPPQGATSVEPLERDPGLVETCLFELRNGVLATTMAKCGGSFATGGSDKSE